MSAPPHQRRRTPDDYLHHRRLTDRELQCLAGAAHGLTNAEIGARLFLTEDTVKTHFRRALRKLGACDRTQAVVHAIGLGYFQAVDDIDGAVTLQEGPREAGRSRTEHVGMERWSA